MIVRLARLAPAALLMAVMAALAACDRSGPGTRSTGEMPIFDDASLAAGRAIWMGTCRNCHLFGAAGAPAVTDFAQWNVRLGKGKSALYQSALGGVRGQDGQYRMPPHGGNPRLSADQVRLAVDYKIAAIERLRGLLE